MDTDRHRYNYALLLTGLKSSGISVHPCISVANIIRLNLAKLLPFVFILLHPVNPVKTRKFLCH